MNALAGELVIGEGVDTVYLFLRVFIVGVNCHNATNGVVDEGDTDAIWEWGVNLLDFDYPK